MVVMGADIDYLHMMRSGQTQCLRSACEVPAKCLRSACIPLYPRFLDDLDFFFPPITGTGAKLAGGTGTGDALGGDAVGAMGIDAMGTGAMFLPVNQSQKRPPPRDLREFLAVFRLRWRCLRVVIYIGLR